MILCDVNVLVCAHKEGVERHGEYRGWLEDAMNGDEAFGVSDFVLSSVLRIVTHPRVYDPPSTWEQAQEFADAVRSAPSAVPIAPGARHWQIFTELASKSRSRQPGAGRLPGRIGDRVRIRVDHHRSRLRALSGLAFPASA